MEELKPFSCANEILPKIQILLIVTSTLLTFTFLLNTISFIVLYKTIYKANAKYYYKSIDVVEQIHHVQVVDNGKVLPAIPQ